MRSTPFIRERDALVVKLRDDGMDFPTIGVQVGLTPERCNQIYHRRRSKYERTCEANEYLNSILNRWRRA